MSNAEQNEAFQTAAIQDAINRVRKVAVHFTEPADPYPRGDGLLNLISHLTAENASNRAVIAFLLQHLEQVLLGRDGGES